MRCFEVLKEAGWAAQLFLAASRGSLLQATPAQAVTPADVDLAFRASVRTRGTGRCGVASGGSDENRRG